MRHSFLSIIFLVGCLSVSLGQKVDTITHRLETPYKALNTFVTNMEDEQYNPAGASIIFNQPGLSLEKKIEYAKTFEEIMEGAGIYIFFSSVPTSPDYFDSLNNEHRYIISNRYPEIYLQKQRDRWQFQPEVMQEMDSIHKEMYKYSGPFLMSEETRESKLGAQFLGLKLWQWLRVFALLVICYLIRYIFNLIFGRVLVRLLEKVGYGNVGSKYITPVSKPTAMIVVLLFIAAVYPGLQMPRLFGFYVVLALKALVPLYGMIILYQLVNIFEIYLNKLVKKTSSSLDDQLVPLVKKILKVVIVIVGGLVILDSVDVPILPLLTGLSIGGLAFALAAQDTIKNFFGSLMIFIDKPFQIGDWIVTGDIDGTVEEVGFRSTRIRTFRNSVIYVPNGQLADTTIDNNGLRQFRRFKTTIGITYDTPPELVETFVDGLKRILHAHPDTNKEKYEIHFNNLGPSSLDILFYIFFEAPTWTDELKFRQEILLEIMKLAQHLGVHFAFPTQTLHVDNFPGKDSLTPGFMQDKTQMTQRLDEFFKA